MKHIKICLLSICLLVVSSAMGQVAEHVHWTVSQKADKLTLKATIDTDWHLTVDSNACISFKINDIEYSARANTAPIKEYDEDLFEWLYYFEKSAVFTASCANIEGLASMVYQACNNAGTCTRNEFEFEVQPAKQKPQVEEKKPVVEEQKPIVEEQKQEFVAEDTTTTTVFEQINEAEEQEPAADRSLWWVFVMGLLGGLMAIFTPCVWPLIPMTVSFFIKRASGWKSAVMYGISIILIYVGLGLLITVIFGASALNALSTSAVANLIFFALLVVFAISFFGAFEITLPSSWSTKLDNKARSTTGFLSLLFMAFVLVLVSFSCTGPIIGTLLVEAAGHSLLAPTIGMLGFALALALPFSLFALFPNALKKLPKSGSWMNRLKVVLAFLELALSLKFLSVADLAYGWHILDRETFVALWVVIFALLGCYLLGWIRFPHDDKKEKVSVQGFMLAVVSLAFAAYLLPGLWGAPLKAVSAFVPPMNTQDFCLNTKYYEAPEVGKTINWEDAHKKYTFEELQLLSKHEGKPLMIDFSGYGCVNCRKLEAKVLSDNRVEPMLKQYLMITVYVDDKTDLAEPLQVRENNKTITLKTVGDYWSYIQRQHFGANAQPYLVVVDAKGQLLKEPYTYDDNPENFLEWLK